MEHFILTLSLKIVPLSIWNKVPNSFCDTKNAAEIHEEGPRKLFNRWSNYRLDKFVGAMMDTSLIW